MARSKKKTKKSPQAALGGHQSADVRTDDLDLDISNPRLVGDLEPGAPEAQLQIEALRVLWKKYSLEELILSIAENGFWRHEPLVALADGTVIEGNRRLAAVRLLRSRALCKEVGADSVPKLTSKALADLETLPVIRAKNREDVWAFVGFKHVNGPQMWRSHAKAKYVAWVHDELGVPLAEIAQTIGDTHSTVERFYHALKVLEQAETAGFFTISDNHKTHFSFSHLMTGLSYEGIRAFLGLKSGARVKPEPVAKKSLPRLSKLMRWLYGSKSEGVPPLVRSQNPDLRRLENALQNRRGIEVLEAGLPLEAAEEAALGDDRVLARSLEEARVAISKASSVASAYDGARATFELAEDILSAAETLVDALETRRKRLRSGRRLRKKKGR